MAVVESGERSENWSNERCNSSDSDVAMEEEERSIVVPAGIYTRKQMKEMLRVATLVHPQPEQVALHGTSQVEKSYLEAVPGAFLLRGVLTAKECAAIVEAVSHPQSFMSMTL